MNECTFDMQIPCVSGCPLYVRYPDPQCILPYVRRTGPLVGEGDSTADAVGNFCTF